MLGAIDNETLLIATALIVGGQSGVTAILRSMIRTEVRRMHEAGLARLDWACRSIVDLAAALGHPLREAPPTSADDERRRP